MGTTVQGWDPEAVVPYEHIYVMPPAHAYACRHLDDCCVDPNWLCCGRPPGLSLSPVHIFEVVVLRRHVRAVVHCSKVVGVRGAGAFELLNNAGPLRFEATVSGQPADGPVSVLATADNDDGAGLQLFISNMVPLHVGKNCTPVEVDITVAVNSSSTMSASVARVTVIDADHANPVEEWERRGAPLKLSREDTAALMEASLPGKSLVNVTHRRSSGRIGSTEVDTDDGNAGGHTLGLRLLLPATSVAHVQFGQ